MKLYSFDEGSESLDLLPLAARRALDRAGLHLSLAGWRSLSRDVRGVVVQAGSEDEVRGSWVAQSVEDARPAATSQPPVAEPPADAPPPEVVRAYAASGPLDVRVWAALAPVDRYALWKVAQRGRAERLRDAYAEIVGYSRVSTHVRADGGVRMVNVGSKPETRRSAQAGSRVSMSREAFELLTSQSVPKGDVLSTARLAGIMAAKRTAELIPLCHVLRLNHVAVDLELDADASAVQVRARVETAGQTGVEMEALVAASTAALTVYDMLKSADRGMQIGPTCLLSKSGGASGDYRA